MNHRGDNDRYAFAREAALALAALIVAAPIAATLAGAVPAAGDGLLTSQTGLRYFATTLILCALVGIGATALGAGAAMIVCLADFPGRRVFTVLLALPFAIPAYVAAYAYGDFLGPFGPVAGFVGPANLPEIRSLPGAAFILILMTYPYVYLALAASLSSRSGAYMEAARALGAGPMRAAFKILLAAGRPALAGGLALALMETAADYGVADYFGVPSLSVGIFRTWQGLGDLAGATQLAAMLFFVALVLALLEEAGRRGAVAESARAPRASGRLKLAPHHAAGAIGFISLPVVFGFIVPAGVLIAKLDVDLSVGAARGLSAAIVNTAAVAGAGAGIAALLALALAYAARRSRGGLNAVLLRIATMGYAIPGAVIAIGVLALTAMTARTTGAAVAGGVGVLLYAYVARFLTAGYNAAAGGLEQISLQMDAAAHSLGAGPGRIVSKIHWPLSRGAVAAGAAIVAIDIAKELPATLLLRPFNFETLATHVYRLASDERLADAAPAALLLIGLSLVPVIALNAAAMGGAAARRQAAAR